MNKKSISESLNDSHINNNALKVNIIQYDIKDKYYKKQANYEIINRVTELDNRIRIVKIK